jgi:hypothetical protein
LELVLPLQNPPSHGQKIQFAAFAISNHKDTTI